MLGLSIPSVAYRNPASLAARVNALFRAGEQGVWYDPSDRTTLYQNAAGTTPVTAMEQPVGMILDKSKGLVLGAELVTNGTFDSDTGWTKGAGWTISGGALNASSAAVGTATYKALSGLKANTFYEVTCSISNYSAGYFYFNFYAGAASGWQSGNGTKKTVVLTPASVVNANFGVVAVSSAFTGTIDNISVRELPGNHAYQSTSASRPVLSARVNQYLNTATLATQSVTTLATTYTLRFDGAGSITLSGTATGTYTAGAHSVVCTAGTLTSTVTGTVTNADLRPTNSGINLPPYQRVTTHTDYDTAGFPAYLKFDGIDDSLVTNSIDFTATDKMTVCAGVRKLSDAAFQVMVELSASADSNNGSFVVGPATLNGDTSRRTWGAKLQGNLSNLGGAGVYSAPDSRVATSLLDIGGTSAATENSMRLNGVTQSLTYWPSDAGTGNFGNYPLYIGSRAGTSMRYNGHLYSLIVRGAQSSDAQISSVERYVNGKTKAYT